MAAAGKNADCFLGLLYVMDNIAVYGYITPLRVKIVLGLALNDFVVRDVEVIMVWPSLFSSSAVLILSFVDIQSPAQRILLFHVQPVPQTRNPGRQYRFVVIHACGQDEVENVSKESRGGRVSCQ